MTIAVEQNHIMNIAVSFALEILRIAFYTYDFIPEAFYSEYLVQ